MEKEKLKRVVEALLFITDSPLSSRKLKEITKEPVETLKEVINELKVELEERGSAVFITEVAGGSQMATKPEYGEWSKKLYLDKITYRLSRSAMETLAIIAYKQPVTRSEIEEIRGVDAAGVLENLLEKKLVRICGRKEAPGKPILYGTTSEFLKYFGLKNIAEIPSIDELVPPQMDGDEITGASEDSQEELGLETGVPEETGLSDGDAQEGSADNTPDAVDTSDTADKSEAEVTADVEVKETN